MSRVQLEGTVDSDGLDNEGLFEVGPRIGGQNVANAVTDEIGCGAESVRVLLLVEADDGSRLGEGASGRLQACNGFGGTDVTPFEPAEAVVGGLDILERLAKLDGRTVALTVEVDE